MTQKNILKRCQKKAFSIYQKFQLNTMSADPAVVKELERKYACFQKSESKSLLKQHLGCDIFNNLKCKKTSYNMSLMDCIQSGMANLDSECGLYAGCPECYDVFADLFNPVIEAYHGFKACERQPPLDFGDPNSLTDLDPEKKLVISTRVRCGRTIIGYPFNPGMNECQYSELEGLIVKALSQLTGDFQGSYKSLKDMTTEEKNKLISDHFLFQEGDKYLQAANACRYWPKGRGIYFNCTKTFIVWVNEEDHMRIISLQEGGNLGQVYKRLVDGVTALSKCLKFLRHDRLGYLTFCPTNVGTTIRASVHIKIPNSMKDPSKVQSFANKYKLQIRGRDGEHSESKDGVYDISNKRRLGVSEIDVIGEMQLGVKELIKLETGGGC